MTIGKRIAYYRNKMNLSQEALGNELGVSRQAVSKWESDQSLPDSNNLIQLSKFFSISLSNLIDGDAIGDGVSEEHELQLKDSKKENYKNSSKNSLLLFAFILAILSILGLKLINNLEARVEELEYAVMDLNVQVNQSQIQDNQVSYHFTNFLLEPSSINYVEQSLGYYLNFNLKEDSINSKVLLMIDNESYELARSENGDYEFYTEKYYKNINTLSLSIIDGERINNIDLSGYIVNIGISNFIPFYTSSYTYLSLEEDIKDIDFVLTRPSFEEGSPWHKVNSDIESLEVSQFEIVFIDENEKEVDRYLLNTNENMTANLSIKPETLDKLEKKSEWTVKGIIAFDNKFVVEYPIGLINGSNSAGLSGTSSYSTRLGPTDGPQFTFKSGN